MKAKTKRKLVSHSRTCFQNMSWKWFIYKKIQNPNFILRTKQFDCCVLFIFFPQKLTTTFQIKIKQKLKNATDNQTHFSKIPNHVFKIKWERERERERERESWGVLTQSDYTEWSQETPKPQHTSPEQF